MEAMNLLLILIVTLFLSSSAFAWTWTADFESGTLGQVASGTSGFDYAAARTTYTSEIAHSGTKSCKLDWYRGSDGDGCAAWWPATQRVTSNGGELWVRGYYYFKSPWSWTCDPAVKILRAVVRTSGNAHIGYHSILSNTNGQVTLSNEVQDYQPESTVAFGTDQWVCLELYVKFSPTTPTVRIWRNGVLVFEDKSHRTADSTTDFCDGGWVMSYWNGGAPQAQVMYVDDFQATTDTPSNRDAAGNPMIGPIDWSSSDTTAPTVSITTSSPQTITSNSLTVIGTASDAVGVTSCKYRIGSEPGASAGTACTGTTSWTCATSGYTRGTNTLYVGCGDAAGNWGSDSITVSYNILAAVTGLKIVGGN